ncbi:key lime pathogenicity protein [Phlyctema vagabunda]|uniref:Key lime pathogenicity protein n=1 Tax=Phlyctema vagabunda TaxID=108571 RepID=A0ABR4PXZ2_9HELO
MSGLRMNDIEQKRQFLLAQLAELEALQPTTAPISSVPSLQQHRSPIHKHHNVPRSISSSGTSMARHASDQRPRNLSQRSAPGSSMARTTSRGTSSARSGNLPFTSTGNVPVPRFETHREQPDVAAWVEQEQPFNPYTYTHQQAASQRRPNLEQVPEHQGNVLEDPADFLNRHGAPTLSITPSPMSIPVELTSNHHSSIGLQQHQHFGIQTPTTPAESLTTATTLASEMSRQNSLCNEPFIHSVEMMKFNSSSSFRTDNLVDENQVAPHFISYPSRRSSKEDQSQIIFGAGGASQNSQFLTSFPSAEALAQFSPSDCLANKMERSESNESTSSTSSSASRHKARLQAQNQYAAKRALAPKGGDEIAMSRESSSQSVSQSPSSAAQDKLAISKPSYVRPKHDRVQCTQCDEYPDGFRGEHELRRHQDRVHKPMVKKWMCVEPTGPEHPKPVLALSRCKTCTHAKKKYGAYYNAAAHLRRAHFRPKSKGRSKSSKTDKDAEKRGGKAGGDWPPMSELKYWMVMVDEPATENSQSQQDDDESEDETPLDDANKAMNADLNFIPQPLNAYQPIQTPLYAMQEMQLSHSQQSIDLYQSTSQNSVFDSFPQAILPNDASATFMFDHSPFLDQSVGLDFVNLNPNFSYQ